MARITPYQLDLFTAHTVDLYRDLENEIFQQIANRLKNKGTADILDWQVQKLSELHLLGKSVVDELSKISGVASKDIQEAIEKTGYGSINDIDNELSNHFETKGLPSDLDNVLRSYAEQVFIDLNNFVNQTLINTQYGSGPIAKIYEDIINKTTARFISGMTTFDKALEQTILEWAKKGVESTFIDKGFHTWSMERYVETVLRSTYNRTYNDLRTSRMSEYGVFTVIMSTVSDAAPRCAYCQGKVLDMRKPDKADSGYPSIYQFGYGKAGGTLGINCRHSIHPFIPGVNKNNQPKINPKESIRRSKIRDKQREIERRIRRTKKNIMITEALGSDSVNRYKSLLLNQQAQMRELIKNNGHLFRDYKREKVYTPKEVLSSDPLYSQMKKDDIMRTTINTEKFNRHVKGAKEFEEYYAKGTKAGGKPSYLTISKDDAQKLIDEKLTAKDFEKNKKMIVANKPIGVYVNQKTGEEEITNKAIIHISKTGIHIVPTKPDRKE